jgi:hypothetical protein
MIALALFALLAALQLGDWWTSWRASGLPGAYEANPVMAWLIRKLGFHDAFALKLMAVALLGFALMQMRWPGTAMLAVADAFYGFIAWHNWRLR